MPENMDKKRVGILRGGEGDHYESSLTKGGEIISHLLENFSDKYKPIDIFIDREGVWHIGGLPIKPVDLMHKVDIVWNTSHPNLNNILKNLSVPNIGERASVLETSRIMLNEHIKNTGINMPRHLILPVYQKDFDGLMEGYVIKKAKEVHEKFGAPWIVRALNSNIGVHVAKTFPELVDAINDVVSHHESILVEELISGKNAFMHTVSGFRGEDVYAFPAKGISIREKVPTPKGVGIPTESVGKKLEELAKNIHKQLGVSHYLKSNFVLNPKKGIFLTSVEFSPDLKPDSHFHKVCESVGAKTYHVIGHILESAL